MKETTSSTPPVGKHPLPRKKRKKPLKKAGFAFAYTLAAGVGLIAVLDWSSPTLGSTRSSRIRWQVRREEVDKVVDGACDAPVTTPENPEL